MAGCSPTGVSCPAVCAIQPDCPTAVCVDKTCQLSTSGDCSSGSGGADTGGTGGTDSGGTGGTVSATGGVTAAGGVAPVQ
jgi:hypothetical protein